ITDSLEAQQAALGEHAAALGAGRAVPETAGDAAQLAEWQRIQGQIVAAKRESAAKQAEIDGRIKVSNVQTAEALVKTFQKAAMEIERQFERAFDGVIRGTESVKFAFIKLGGDLVLTIIHSLEQMLFRWIAHYAAVEAMEHISLVHRL